jgi:hypothetical protein
MPALRSSRYRNSDDRGRPLISCRKSNVTIPGRLASMPGDPVGVLIELPKRKRPSTGGDLALQLPFCFEVSALSDGLVSSAPERPCDDVCGLDALSSESGGDAADFLD